MCYFGKDMFLETVSISYDAVAEGGTCQFLTTKEALL